MARRTKGDAQKAITNRVLQYVDDAMVDRASAVYIDRWLLAQGAVKDPDTRRTSRIGSIFVWPDYRAEKDLTARLEIIDGGECRRELKRRKVCASQRASDFEYAEDWSDWSEATERANDALEAAAITSSKITDKPAEAGKPATAVQERLLLYVGNALETNAHWTAVDAWIAETAARDAQAGHGQTGAPQATPWGQKEAEFEIRGVWIRVEHRRLDETKRADTEPRRLALLAEIRLLDPARAERLLGPK